MIEAVSFYSSSVPFKGLAGMIYKAVRIVTDSDGNRRMVSPVLSHDALKDKFPGLIVTFEPGKKVSSSLGCISTFGSLSQAARFAVVEFPDDLENIEIWTARGESRRLSYSRLDLHSVDHAEIATWWTGASEGTEKRVYRGFTQPNPVHWLSELTLISNALGPAGLIKESKAYTGRAS